MHRQVYANRMGGGVFLDRIIGQNKSSRNKSLGILPVEHEADNKIPNSCCDHAEKEMQRSYPRAHRNDSDSGDALQL